MYIKGCDVLSPLGITFATYYTSDRYTWLTKTIEINDCLQHTSKVASTVGQTCFSLLNIFYPSPCYMLLVFILTKTVRDTKVEKEISDGKIVISGDDKRSICHD